MNRLACEGIVQLEGATARVKRSVSSLSELRNGIETPEVVPSSKKSARMQSITTRTTLGEPEEGGPADVALSSLMVR